MAIDYGIFFINIKIIVMTKSSIKKVSMLGLVLIAASAVTAAMMPNKEKRFATGRLAFDSTTPSKADQATCRPDDLANDCVATIGSATTTDGNGNTNGSSVDSITTGATNTTAAS